VWVYAADHAAKGLAGFDRFAHVADVIDSDDTERHDRLFAFLESTLDERLQRGADANDEPLVIVVIDGVAGFAERNNLSSGSDRGDLFARIVRDGPAVGIVFAIGALTPKDIPRSLRGGFRTTVVHELVDDADYSAVGIKPKDVPGFVPGRAVIIETGTTAQVVDWEGRVEPSRLQVAVPPPSVEPLAGFYAESDLPRATLGPPLQIPIGITNRTRSVAAISVRPGEHLTVAGPAGSGRTSTLLTIAAQLRRSIPDLVLVGVSPSGVGAFREEVMDAAGTVDDLEPVFALAADRDRRWVFLVDDADAIEVERGFLSQMARNPQNHVTIVAAVRSSSARQSFGHWTRFVRASGVGVILSPDNAADGELFGVRLPRGERLPNRPGRGYLLASGTATDMQVAH